MIPAELAEILATAIFKMGDEPDDMAQRIQFMGGTYPGRETTLGGLNKLTLTLVIRRVLEDLASGARMTGARDGAK